MHYLKHLLTLSSIWCFLNFTEAQPTPQINVAVENTDNDISSWDRLYNQMELVKSGNDILKLRLEMMELQIGKLGHYFTGIDHKLQSLEDALQQVLKTQLESPDDSHIDDSINTLDVQINNITAVDNNEMVEAPLNNSHSVEMTTTSNGNVKLSAEMIATEKLFMTDMNGDESLKVCSPKADKSLVCSDITLPTSCANSTPDACWNNKCYIQNQMNGWKPFWVSCNDTIDGGGWTVIQRRINGSVDFLRNWADYKKGFGELDGEFWIGLDKLHALTNGLAPVELYVQLIDFANVEKYAKYNSFAIGDEQSKYILKSLGSYSGNAGDSLGPHLNMKFTTKDNDNDNYSGNCVDLRQGAWWYDRCAYSNLNGRYFKEGTQPTHGDRNGISWYEFHHPDYSMKSVQMMIRPKNK